MKNNLKRNKILIFNGYYYPAKNCGGPVTSIENIVNSCYDEFDFYIVCYNHDWNDTIPFNRDINIWYELGNAQVMYVPDSYLDFSITHMKELFISLKPNLVWFSGVLTPNNKIVAAICGKKYNIPILFSPRGEVSADRIALKKYKKVLYLKLVNLLGIFKKCFFHGTSDDEIAGLKKYFKPVDDHLFKVANISILQQPDIIKYYKQKDRLRVMFFSRIHEVKNLLYAVKCVCNCKQKIDFDVYGPMESPDYWEECMRVFNSAPVNINIKYCGIISKENLSQTIQKYDCFLFPTINENYGHVIAEALANSRPVILSKGTTPWDDLDCVAGYAIELNSPQTFTDKLDYYASLDNKQFEDIINSTKEYFKHKTISDGAIEGHKEMFCKIIADFSNLTNTK